MTSCFYPKSNNKYSREIEQLVQERAYLPVEGLVGEEFVNVLELNIELCNRYGVPPN